MVVVVSENEVLRLGYEFLSMSNFAIDSGEKLSKERLVRPGMGCLTGKSIHSHRAHCSFPIHPLGLISHTAISVTLMELSKAEAKPAKPSTSFFG